MIVAGIELTDEQFFELREYFYTEHDKEHIRKLLNVVQNHAGSTYNKAVDAYIGAHKKELIETYTPNMERYFDESLDLCARCLNRANHYLPAPIADSLWDELPWSRIEKEFEEDTE